MNPAMKGLITDRNRMQFENPFPWVKSRMPLHSLQVGSKHRLGF